MIWAFLASAAIIGMYVWQDGFVDCPDGKRYTSWTRQPSPFNRRFCHWPYWPLVCITLASLVTLGTLMGDWKKALLFVTLPGAWLVTTRPTTVDAPCMLAAWVAGLLFPAHPWVALALSILSGFMHERGPVFAALYAGSVVGWAGALLLVGLVGVMWWRKPAPPDADLRVGRGLVWAIFNHRPDHDWMDWRQTTFAMRGLPLLAAFFGVSTVAWAALGLAWMTRLICTDLGRMTLWAAPLIIRDLPDVPAWVVLVQAVSFRRLG